MGFSEFCRGMTSEQVEYLKKGEKTRLLRERFNKCDDYLNVLRPKEKNLPGSDERFEQWKVKDSQ